MNVSLLEYEMKQNGYNKKDEFGKALGISKSAFYRKTHGLSEFTRDEIEKIIAILNLSEEKIRLIFFT